MSFAFVGIVSVEKQNQAFWTDHKTTSPSARPEKRCFILFFPLHSDIVCLIAALWLKVGLTFQTSWTTVWREREKNPNCQPSPYRFLTKQANTFSQGHLNDHSCPGKVLCSRRHAISSSIDRRKVASCWLHLHQKTSITVTLLGGFLYKRDQKSMQRQLLPLDGSWIVGLTVLRFSRLKCFQLGI